MRALMMTYLFAGLAAAQPAQVTAALAAGGYFPLDVGNRWVFRADSRAATAPYETWRIDRTEEIGGRQYAVITVIGGLQQTSNNVLGEGRFRADDQGRVFILTDKGDQLFFDPRAVVPPGTPPASYPLGTLVPDGAGGEVVTAVGTFIDT